MDSKNPARHRFAQLKCQTHHSILRSIAKTGDVVALAAKQGRRFLGICDHNTLSGFYEFYSACRSAGIKPVIGATVDVTDPAPWKSGTAFGHRVTLFCKNREGLDGLISILNAGHLRRQEAGRANLFAVDSSTIFEYSKNLICTLPGVTSFLGRGPAADPDGTLAKYIDSFGRERLFLELWKDSVPGEDEMNVRMLEISRKYELKTVAASNCQYLAPSHRKSFAAAYAMRNGISLPAAMEKLERAGNFHFRSDAEFEGAFSHLGQSLENSLDIAFACNLEMEDTAPKMPGFGTPEGFSEDTYLEFISREELSRRRLSSQVKYAERLSRELEIIRSLGFSGYFLTVRDIVDHAKSSGIPVGPGRGSACSSLVCFLLGITRIDPIRENLMFERFLNPHRVKMPDIDIDFASAGRYEIIKYLIKRFGVDRVAQIITFSHFKHKALVWALSRILDAPSEAVHEMAGLMDRFVARDPHLGFSEVVRDAVFSKFERTGVWFRQMCEIAPPLLNNIRQTSIHAGGVVISPVSLPSSLPLHFPNDGVNMTALDMNSLEALGYLKMDLLGINALEKIEDIKKAIASAGAAPPDIDSVPLDDKKTFDLISSGETFGVFQIETRQFRDFLPKIRVSSIDELAVAIALIRPGPLRGGVVSDYISRKSGRSKPAYPIAGMEEILSETFGLIVFQEQIMRIATDIFGYSFSDADVFRDIMTKKKRDRVEGERARFIEAGQKRGITLQDSARTFDLIANFAEYGFNKAHSVAYSRVAYAMAYYMANYPAEYMTALLNSDVKARGLEFDMKIDFLKRRGIRLLELDANRSGLDYSIEQVDGSKHVRSGFMKIPGISTVSAAELVAERARGGEFRDFGDFLGRPYLTAGRSRLGELEAVIRAGAFDGIGGGASREAMVAALREAMSGKKRPRQAGAAGQISFPDSQPGRPEGLFLREGPSWKAPPEFFDEIRFVRASGVSAFLKQGSGAARIYGRASSFAPPTSEIVLSDIFNEGDSIAVKLSGAAFEELTKIDRGDVIFVEASVAGSGGTLLTETGEERASMLSVTTGSIISYREARLLFTSYIEIRAASVDGEAVSMIKHVTERYPGTIPLYIKTSEYTIATNRKVMVNERFVREISSIAGLSGEVEAYIDFKMKV